jgi:hypothetical protein
MAKKVYIAGPMRGRKLYNFPEFDRVGGILLAKGYKVMSPADFDRKIGFDPWELPEDHDWNKVPDGFDVQQAFFRDLGAIAECDFICLLDGWTDSVGARCEYFAARWLGLQFLVEEGGKIYELGPGWEPASLIHASEIPKVVATAMASESAGALPESILAEAQRITGGDRQAQYGPPDQDFSRTAGMWTSLFGELLKDGARFDAKHVAMAMIVVKLSRLMYGAKRDSVVDIAGYAHCLSLCDGKTK